jgi:hypothetical protein
MFYGITSIGGTTGLVGAGGEAICGKLLGTGGEAIRCIGGLGDPEWALASVDDPSAPSTFPWGAVLALAAAGGALWYLTRQHDYFVQADSGHEYFDSLEAAEDWAESHGGGKIYEVAKGSEFGYGDETFVKKVYA